MSKFKDWLVKEGLVSPKPSAAPLVSTSTPAAAKPVATDVFLSGLFTTVETDVAKAVSSVESHLPHFQKAATPMSQVSRVTFHRLHKFKENGVAFTPAQIAAAQYTVLVGSPGGQKSYAVPAALLANLAPNVPVTVPFSSIGFVPVPGTTYHISVVVTLDGVTSDVSPEVSFTNSLTPAPVDTVSVS